jgi:hypothetical protein
MQTQRAAAVQRAAQRAQNLKDFQAHHPQLTAWLSTSRLSFAQSLNDALQRSGTLTTRQLDAAIKCMHDSQERVTKELATAAEIDVGKILAAFSTAQSKGVARPRMRLGTVMFTTAPASGANAGALYVKTTDDARTYLGKVTNGKFVRSRDCTAEQEAEIVAMASDPMNAAIAYGRRTGECAICGRELTNHASIDVGIGPICAEKFGF